MTEFDIKLKEFKEQMEKPLPFQATEWHLNKNETLAYLLAVLLKDMNYD
jgi:hypothetical protein